MKKLISLLLAMTLAATCALPAGAVDDEEAEASPAPVTVTTAEELLEAIEAAEDGDTIRIGDTITITESVTFGQERKRLYLERGDGFSGIMFSGTAEAVTFESFIIEGGGTAASIIDSSSEVASDNQLMLKNVWISNSGDSAVKVTNENLVIENCCFEGGRAKLGAHLWISTGGETRISDSTFKDGYSDTIGGSIRNMVGQLIIDNCSFIANTAGNSGGAIYVSGRGCSISNSVITHNCAGTSGSAEFGSGYGGGIYASDAISLTNTAIFKNTATVGGADIYANAKISITLSESDLATVYHVSGRAPVGFFLDSKDDRFDGETNITTALPMPINYNSASFGLIFALDGDITAQIIEPEQPPAQEQQPDHQESAEPTQPSEPEAHQGQEQPEESTPTPEPEPEPEQPSAAAAPPSVAPSSNPPSRSYTRSTEDSDTSETIPAPAEQTEPESAAPALSCGGAALDTSGRAFLAGYGDGVIGEDDLVTRAQIAQIIYRLMTDESREALQTTENSFEDVPAEAWYNLAVSTIARAGIVVGTGDGFHPEGYITRAQLITIMARFIAPAEQGSSYADVTGHWAESFIGTAEAAGWLTGGGHLHPNEYISRREVVEFINHVFDLCEEAA